MRIAPADADAALSRSQPVAESDLAWGCSYTTTWDGKYFQVLRRRLDEAGEPAFDYDDDGVQWAAFDTDDAATGEAAQAWQRDHPNPDEVFLSRAADGQDAEGDGA